MYLATDFDIQRGQPARPIDQQVVLAAAERLAGLAIPAGALGRLGETAVRIAGMQGVSPTRPIDRVRAVIFAGDHGVSGHGVSAYPREITGLMVGTFVTGGAGVSVLARQHRVRLRVLDLGVDSEPFPGGISDYKVRRSSEPIQLADALTGQECRSALAAGAAVAAEEIAAGADLLIVGDMGIGNTTPTAALIAAVTGHAAADVVGRGTGVDDAALEHKTAVIQRALDRVAGRTEPVDLLAALGSADLAAGVGFLVTAVRAGVPVLLDGLIAVAEAVLAEAMAPGARDWFLAGHRSTEPAQTIGLAALGLEPLLDLGMRLGEGSGAVLAVPVVRSAALLLAEMALLSDLIG